MKIKTKTQLIKMGMLSIGALMIALLFAFKTSKVSHSLQDCQTSISYEEETINLFYLNNYESIENLSTYEQSLLTPSISRNVVEACLSPSGEVSLTIRPKTPSKTEGYKLIDSFEDAEVSKMELSNGRMKLYDMEESVMYDESISEGEGRQFEMLIAEFMSNPGERDLSIFKNEITANEGTWKVEAGWITAAAKDPETRYTTTYEIDEATSKIMKTLTTDENGIEMNLQIFTYECIDGKPVLKQILDQEYLTSDNGVKMTRQSTTNYSKMSVSN